MINNFSEWSKKISEILSKRNIYSNLQVGKEEPNPCAKLDIETEYSVARITCWDSGHYTAEIINSRTFEFIFSSEGMFKINGAIPLDLITFFKKLELNITQ